RQAQLQDAIDAAGGWELERKLEIAADALRLPPWEASIATLSGGEKRRVALCRLLLSAPDMLLLDEPTNHLDAESIAWLERYLEEYPSTVIAVTHDRYFLDNVAGWILELDRGYGIPWHGNYSSWLEQKEQRLALEEREQQALRKALAHELEWVRQNPKARQAKSKARLQRYEELATREVPQGNETHQIYIPPGERVRRPARRCRGHRHRPHRAPRLRRPVAPGSRCQEDRMAGALRRSGHHQGGCLRNLLARLRRALQLPRHSAAATGRGALGRRAQPRAPPQGA